MSLLTVDADMTVEEVLRPEGAAGQPSAQDSLDMIEAELALEEESNDRARVRETLGVAGARHVLRTLLGAAADQSTWEPNTVWLRSLRGFVNERVRHREGCTCAEARTPSNKEYLDSSRQVRNR